jgi:hypothetical protein
MENRMSSLDGYNLEDPQSGRRASIDKNVSEGESTLSCATGEA